MRRYATTIIRDFNNVDRYELAKDKLLRAKGIYCKIDNQFKDQPEQYKIVAIEYQKTLHLLCKVALELKDGKLLNKTALLLLLRLEITSNETFAFEAYEYMYQAAFAKGDFMSAKFYVKESISLIEEGEWDITTPYRHLAKINLAELAQKLAANELGDLDVKQYFIDHIEKYFLQSFDAHADNFDEALELGHNSKWSKRALNKDFMFLFSMRCLKSLLNLDDGEKPFDFTQSIAGELYSERDIEFRDIEFIERRLMQKIEDIFETGRLSLAYQLFADKEPPHIVINKENFELLFPNYKASLPSTNISANAQSLFVNGEGQSDVSDDESVVVENQLQQG